METAYSKCVSTGLTKRPEHDTDVAMVADGTCIKERSKSTATPESLHLPHLISTSLILKCKTTFCAACTSPPATPCAPIRTYVYAVTLASWVRISETCGPRYARNVRALPTSLSMTARVFSLSRLLGRGMSQIQAIFCSRFLPSALSVLVSEIVMSSVIAARQIWSVTCEPSSDRVLVTSVKFFLGSTLAQIIREHSSCRQHQNWL